MKKKRKAPKYFLSVLTALLLFCFMTACGQDEGPVLDCPFTELTWNSTIDDMTAAEGENYSTYDSLYGGLCYTYPKEYEGCSGTVKYMFDVEKYGESGYDAGGVGNYGGVWYRENGDIILTTMVTTENKALQYAYLHPLVSNTEER